MFSFCLCCLVFSDYVRNLTIVKKTNKYIIFDDDNKICEIIKI